MSAEASPTPTRAGAPPAADSRTRVAVGLVMALLILGVLFGDQWLAPWYPCLLGTILLLGIAATLELHQLLADLPRPPLPLCLAGVLAVLAANWPAHLGLRPGGPAPRGILQAAFAAVCLLGFLVEMVGYRRPGGAVVRLSLFTWMVAYLGLLPSFLIQLRWWPAVGGADPGARGVAAFALAVFVPKVGDVGAYFAGRMLGRHPMTPLLSPRKTWEGLAGGLAGSVLAALVLNRLQPGLLAGEGEAAGFGLVVGLAGVLGDLAESLVKRDCGQKDASQAVPGFGGVLDVVDSILFAAPVAYWWLRGPGG